MAGGDEEVGKMGMVMRGEGGGSSSGGGSGDGVIVGQDPGGDGMPIKQGKVE